MSKQNVSTFTASKSAGKLYFSLISGVKMPQIRSIIGRHEEKKSSKSVWIVKELNLSRYMVAGESARLFW